MNKAIVSHHGQLLAHEAEVRAWWEKVPERVKRDWLSAKAIHRHWTNSKKPVAAPRNYAPVTELQEQAVEAKDRRPMPPPTTDEAADLSGHIQRVEGEASSALPVPAVMRLMRVPKHDRRRPKRRSRTPAMLMTPSTSSSISKGD
jgi:hypothetical protein